MRWFFLYSAELVTSLITTHFICVSSKDVKTGIQLFPRFRKKNSIIRAAVEWETFFVPSRVALPFPEHNAPFIFGTVSCFKPQKNLLDLLQAFERVHQQMPHTKLEIIGDGVLRPILEQWIQEHNLEAAITLHGWQHNVAPLMLNWHSFVLSSLWEGLPCAVVEARLLKLPVISYNVGGIRDVITHEENGFLCKPGNWQELADNMCHVALDKNCYQKFQNYHEDLADFNHQNMIQHHINLYNSL